MVVIAGLALTGLGARLVQIQGLDAVHYAAYGSQEVYQRLALPALRGAVYDRNGNLIAASSPRVDVIADDYLVNGSRTDLGRLASVLGLPEAVLWGKLRERNGYVPLAYQVSGNLEDKIAALDLPYLTFAPDVARTDPDGGLFSPLLGIVGFSGQGLSGLEYLENSLLEGRPGSEVVPTGPDGEGLPGTATDVVAARQGTSLVVSLDEPLQFEVTKDLTQQIRATHATGGIVIVEDRRTGDILAMVDLVTGPHGDVVPSDQNLAVTSVYQPGSVMKLVTISGALQEGLISPSSVFTVPYQISLGGWPFSDADYHPTEQLTATQILAQSSNIGTIEIAHLLGPERLSYFLHDLGFGEPTGLAWPGETDGLVPNPNDAATWSPSSMGTVPIGTGEAVTPLQILDAYNMVANGGVYVAPRLVEATISAKGVEHLLPLQHERRALAPSTVSELLPMLEQVTEDGTALAARIPGYTVAGKTGTAQIPSTTGPGYQEGAWSATFVGFAPAQNPALTTLVMLSHPDLIYGGLASAPVFSAIMRYALRHFDVAPSGGQGLSPGSPAVGGP
ncbi:MAG: peptidoglycan D,D-transpeptidase FtsI family protein [Acidimicrobiales bacterium]|jgi:cell division protein FtsI (penicillin-binding protein 3)